jgi:hypothetical protein
MSPARKFMAHFEEPAKSEEKNESVKYAATTTVSVPDKYPRCGERFPFSLAQK